MKTNILTFLGFAILLTAVSCTTPSSESASTAAELQTSSNRSASAPNQEEDFNLLLARKWQNESGAIFIDLKIDGSFEGKFDSDNVVVGSWSTSDDQKMLSLKEGNTSDGKGGNLNVSYVILDMSPNNMKVSDQGGNEFLFISPEQK